MSSARAAGSPGSRENRPDARAVQGPHLMWRRQIEPGSYDGLLIVTGHTARGRGRRGKAKIRQRRNNNEVVLSIEIPLAGWLEFVAVLTSLRMSQPVIYRLSSTSFEKGGE